MDRLGMILYEFEQYSNQIWTKKVYEVINIKDKEIEKVKQEKDRLTERYLNMEQQRNGNQREKERVEKENKELYNKIKELDKKAEEMRGVIVKLRKQLVI